MLCDHDDYRIQKEVSPDPDHPWCPALRFLKTEPTAAEVQYALPFSIEKKAHFSALHAWEPEFVQRQVLST